MIDRLYGQLLEKQPPKLVLNVSGVGYELNAPMTTFYQLPDLGEPVTLHTHFAVREDAHLLFGFHRTIERDFFRRLIKINGVGPKLALNFLSGMSIEESIVCIENEQISALTRLPGVGKKTAERLVIEMRDWLKTWDRASSLKLDQSQPMQTVPVADTHIRDAQSALIALGYKDHEAKKAIRGIGAQASSSEELIRLALKAMT